MMEPFPERPKGMHRDTYMRLFWKHHEAEIEHLDGLREWSNKLQAERLRKDDGLDKLSAVIYLSFLKYLKRPSLLKKSDRDFSADSTQLLKHWLGVFGTQTGSGVAPRSVPWTDAHPRASGCSIT